MVAVGIGASAQPITIELLLVAVLGLAISACLWWSHFAGDEEAPVEAWRRPRMNARSRCALNAFYYSHLLILLGIIAIAAALEQAIAHPYDHLSFARALSLAGGASLFFLGEVGFRRSLRLPFSRWSVAAAILPFATIPLGTEVSALAQLAALVLVLTGCLVAEGAEPATAEQATA